MEIDGLKTDIAMKDEYLIKLNKQMSNKRARLEGFKYSYLFYLISFDYPLNLILIIFKKKEKKKKK